MNPALQTGEFRQKREGWHVCIHLCFEIIPQRDASDRPIDTTIPISVFSGADAR